MQNIFDKRNIEFTKAFSQHYAVVYGSLYSRTGDPDSAEDMTQEIFIRYLTNMDQAVNVRAWLLVTMKNVLYEHFRRVKNMPSDLAQEEANYDIALTFVNGFRDTRIIIDKAIETVTDGIDRVIFDLVAVQNYTYEETAHELSITKRQVKYRYGLIIRTIVEYLNKLGIKSIEDLL